MFKKIFIIIAFLIFIVGVNFVRATYEIKDDGVYYYQHKIEEVDSATFQKLDVYWAKDNVNVYNKQQSVDGADTETFEVINYEFGKDKNNVYWSSQFSNEVYIIKEADPETFKRLSFDRSVYGATGSKSRYYAKDENNIFYIGINTINNQKIINADRDTFVIIDRKYSMDNDNVYYENSVVIDADPVSFQIIDGSVKDYAIDNNYVYCDGKMLNNSDSKTFEILDSYNAKDKNNAYYNLVSGCEIKSTSSDTFEVLNKNYNKNNENVFFHYRIIESANPETFEVIQDIYSKDKNYVYYMYDIIQGANPQTFAYINNGYAKDSKNGFFQRDMIEGVDLGSFKTTKDNYATDSFSIYYKNTVQKRIPRVREVKNNSLYKSLKGKIILQVEENGEAYYVNPDSKKIYFLARPATAFEVMREQGIGITDTDLEKIPVADDYCPEYNLKCDNKNKHDINFSSGQRGKIFLQVEKNGEAWYVNPNNGKRYFLSRPQDAFNIMKDLGLGISNNDFNIL